MIEPNKNDSKLVPPGVKSDKIPASPIPRLIMIAVAISPKLLNFFLIISIAKLATIQIIIEVKTGFIPIIKPRATPERAV